MCKHPSCALTGKRECAKSGTKKDQSEYEFLKQIRGQIAGGSNHQLQLAIRMIDSRLGRVGATND